MYTYYIYIHIWYIYIYTHTSIRIDIYIYIYVSIFMCFHIYIYIYTCTICYIHTNINVQAYMCILLAVSSILNTWPETRIQPDSFFLINWSFGSCVYTSTTTWGEYDQIQYRVECNRIWQTVTSFNTLLHKRCIDIGVLQHTWQIEEFTNPESRLKARPNDRVCPSMDETRVSRGFLRRHGSAV